MARMTLDQLEIFLATAEHLHFTKAAEALYITQPAVSAAIASLESEYGVKLFHRVGRHIEITETGRLLQLEAQRILTQVTLTERGLAEFNDLQRGELQLGSSLTIGNYWLPAKISDFQERYPAIKINCTLANTEEICLGTANGRFDLALIEGEVKSDLTHCLEQESVGSDRLLIIVGRSHPWYKREAIELPELVETPWVMRESGSGTQQRFEEALRNWGIDLRTLKVTLVLNTGEMVKAIIENSSAAAGISELMVQKELELGTLRSIRVIDTSGLSPRYLEFMRPFLKIKHRQRFQPRVCQVFEQMLGSSPNSWQNSR
ncbi:MAG: LysR family transcriptional regulator [Microcystis aeruginosa Ma_SC_T_19800800_S464]|jgi:DNA-binding transcriptional LysR family regulator|uniref:LysR family transcriptional regulator n=1 Tax=Microcystis aeruginosa Ma_SC_T_19800800_S464 TaxID=2486257 RepID=A0A552DFW2_MICAE|nr:MAG: LysR family transcriptional regulator [Microcystis aeruginosa Ma_SC_T_19800800_S464]